MADDLRRVTLVALGSGSPSRAWHAGGAAKSRLLFVPAANLAAVLRGEDKDVERVILDRCSTPAEYLALLSSLPLQFPADVVFVQDDDSGFMSAMGRGGDRVLYAFTASALHFYLEFHDLVAHVYLARRTA
jgi:hypothetical protein